MPNLPSIHVQNHYPPMTLHPTVWTPDKYALSARQLGMKLYQFPINFIYSQIFQNVEDSVLAGFKNLKQWHSAVNLIVPSYTIKLTMKPQ